MHRWEREQEIEHKQVSERKRDIDGDTFDAETKQIVNSLSKKSLD